MNRCIQTYRYIDVQTYKPMFRLRFSDKYYKRTNNQCSICIYIYTCKQNFYVYCISSNTHMVPCTYSPGLCLLTACALAELRRGRGEHFRMVNKTAKKRRPGGVFFLNFSLVKNGGHYLNNYKKHINPLKWKRNIIFTNLEKGYFSS